MRHLIDLFRAWLDDLRRRREERECERYLAGLSAQFNQPVVGVAAEGDPMPAYYIAKVETVTISGQPTQAPRVQTYPGVNWAAHIPTGPDGTAVAGWCIVKVLNPEILPPNDVNLTGFPQVNLDVTVGSVLNAGQRSTLAARILSTFGVTVSTATGRTLRQVIVDICTGIDPLFDPGWLS